MSTQPARGWSGTTPSDWGGARALLGFTALRCPHVSWSKVRLSLKSLWRALLRCHLVPLPSAPVRRWPVHIYGSRQSTEAPPRGFRPQHWGGVCFLCTRRCHPGEGLSSPSYFNLCRPNGHSTACFQILPGRRDGVPDNQRSVFSCQFYLFML